VDTITKSDLSIVCSVIGMVQLDVVGEEVGGDKIDSNTLAWSDTDSLMRMLHHRVKQHFLLLYGEAEGLARPRACGKAGLPELGWHDAPRDAITP
jgi:hypothetical protein